MDQRRRRWADAVYMLYKCFVFAGYTHIHVPLLQCNIHKCIAIHQMSLISWIRSSPHYTKESETIFLDSLITRRMLNITSLITPSFLLPTFPRNARCSQGRSPRPRKKRALRGRCSFLAFSHLFCCPNEMNRALATFVHIQAKLGQENLLRMVRWLRWHCPPDTGFEIRALAVWDRARYLSVTEAPHNTDFHTWMGKELFCFFQTAETGNRTPNSGVKGSGANHYPRAPALLLSTF